MPYDWVNNEMFMEYRGVTVYHLYKDDFMYNGPYEFHYTTEEDGDGSVAAAFDVRELPEAKDVDKAEANWIRGVIRRAIDNGTLPLSQEDEDEL